MDTEAPDIAKGMKVLSTDGAVLGTVAEVHTPTPEEAEEAGPNRVDGARNRHYVRVERGGIFGVGATNLYIPLDEVVRATPHEGVIVNCTEDNCAERYASKPDVAAQIPGEA